MEVDGAVDLRRVRGRASLGRAPGALVDDHGETPADLGPQLARADLLLGAHEPMPAIVLDLVGHRVGESVRRSPGDRLEAETADAVELRLVEPGEELVEFRVGLTGEADDEGRAYGDVR